MAKEILHYGFNFTRDFFVIGYLSYYWIRDGLLKLCKIRTQWNGKAYPASTVKREGIGSYIENFLLIAESLVSFKDVFARDFNPKDIRYSRGSFDLKTNRNRLNGESSLAGLLERNRFIKNKSTS